MHPHHLIPRDVYMKNDIPVAGCAHQAGTVRFGSDPATSVLDTDCKAHEVDNLYVVDTSFFPSIGAVNPALTAMANALRVGDHLVYPAGDDRGQRQCVGSAANPVARGVKPASTAGVRQPPTPAVTASAAAVGPQVPGAYGWTGRGVSSRGCITRQVSSIAVLPGEPRAVAAHGGVQQDLVRRGALAALGRRTPCRDRSARSGPCRRGGRRPGSGCPWRDRA